MTEPNLKQKVEELIADNPVLLLMKGTPESPGCGNSMRAIAALEPYGVEYAALDVLPALEPLREATGEIADWRTFPQLYVKGELVGGADIMEEMNASGELGELLGAKPSGDVPAPAEPQADRPVTQSPPMQIENS
jgi:monothiol glutaredoxin